MENESGQSLPDPNPTTNPNPNHGDVFTSMRSTWYAVLSRIALIKPAYRGRWCVRCRDIRLPRTCVSLGMKKTLSSAILEAGGGGSPLSPLERL